MGVQSQLQGLKFQLLLHKNHFKLLQLFQLLVASLPKVGCDVRHMRLQEPNFQPQCLSRKARTRDLLSRVRCGLVRVLRVALHAASATGSLVIVSFVCTEPGEERGASCASSSYGRISMAWAASSASSVRGGGGLGAFCCVRRDGVLKFLRLLLGTGWIEVIVQENKRQVWCVVSE